ncbi:hypothetical protein QBC38DRAFT_424985 [Podospora fimiseda]|uniref:Proteophosphoglycan 5 n=1 Tax=Podospora fimiseda TaxID=252190 RepID=A0AAN7GVF9_9PEZI|nr:hypothetical protein QBC38DRAFT_424985 [Podospora fimiseda]
MLQNQFPPKNSPARRRTKRPIHSPARKTYASESDMPTDQHYPIDLSGPITPRKSASNSPVPSTQPNQNKSRSRNGNQASSTASSTTSPGPTKQGRQTPPQSAPPKTTNPSAAATAAAFAGATFHASPAPSSLPIPSFLSKGLDSPGLKDTGRGDQEPSPPATDSEAAPTPKSRIAKADIARQESPLDFFFRAQRAEIEKERRASLGNIAIAPNPAAFSPPVLHHSPSEPKTVPNGFGAARSRRPGFERSSSGISSNELDGTPGAPILPAFSTPWSERLRAARSTSKPAESAPPSPRGPQQQAQYPQVPTDASEKLKQFLAISSPPTNGQNYQTAMSPRGPPPTAGQEQWAFPARAQQTGLATAAMPMPEYNRPAEILKMEDALRQVLKIDGLSLGPSRQPNYQSS